MAISDGAVASSSKRGSSSRVALRHEPAHWHEYNTNVKMRWAGRSLLEVFVTEFRDRTSEYYQYAIHHGLCTVNGKKVGPGHILKQSDRITNRVHRHEPAVTSDPIRILYRNEEEGRLVIVKPGSIPVHPAGRYYKMTLLEMLAREHGIRTVYASNRLDRLTSGIMVCSTKKEVAHTLSEQFAMGKVRKAYVCRVRGRFPQGDVAVDKPLLHCDRQTGISIVHPMGKYSETIFNVLSYDQQTDSSVVYCRPISGRTHQIRVHCQYLGHPILNDPIYAHPLWSTCDLKELEQTELKPDRWLIDPGSTLSVSGSADLDRIVEGLKMEKDNKDDWARWRDEVLFSELLEQDGVERIKVPGPNAVSPASQRNDAKASNDDEESIDQTSYCPECKIPLVPDPKPEELFIYLHAIKYQTDQWTYEDVLPWWALPSWRDTEAEVNGTEQSVMPPAFGLVGRGEQQRMAEIALPPLLPLVSRGVERQSASQESIADFPSIVVEVMGGMEDFAAYDLERHLDLKSGTLQVVLNSAHIILPAGPVSQQAARLFKDGLVNCAKEAYVCIGLQTLHSDTMTKLAVEKRQLYDAKSNVTGLRRKGKIEQAAQIAKCFPSIDRGDQTELETRFLEELEQAWNACGADRMPAFERWQANKGFETLGLQRKPRYRATVDRRGYSLPTLTTAQMERGLGELAWRWLNGDVVGNDKGVWEVDLLEADLEVVLKMLPGHKLADKVDVDAHWRSNEDNVPGCFAFMLSISQQHWPCHRPKDMPHHLVHGGTVLARYRAYILAIACPLLSSPEQKHVRIWESCAGSGSLAVELRNALEQRGIASTMFVSDVLATEIEKCKEMFTLCSPNWYANDDVKIEAVDATDAAACERFVGAPSSIDTILTDLPWGRRVLSHATIAKMYPAFLHTFARMLKPGAIAFLMTAEPKTILRAVKAYEAEARKRNWTYILSVEEINTKGLEDDQHGINVTATDDQRRARLRYVHCGYDVALVLLRKRPLLQ
jgi:RluA family pseudouridine synthase